MAIPSSALRYAASHHGVVTGAALRDGGLSQKQVRHLVETGQLREVHRSVYRTVGTPRSWEQRQLAACLATRGTASHRAALRLWDTAPGSSFAGECPIEVIVDRKSAPSPTGVIVHRTSELDSASVPVRRGIPVTTPMRMLVDLGAVLDQDHVARALERLVIARLVTVDGVRRELDDTARPGRRGVRALRRVLADWPMDDARPDSKLEVDFARLVRGAGLPRPAYQHEVMVGGRRRFIDAAYPELGIAIELDGFAAHADRHIFQDDRRRHNDLCRAGWTVVRFTWHDVVNRPAYVVATIRSLIAGAAAVAAELI